MRIAYIAAGAGTMYCGSCIHDNALAAALQKRGEDAILLPIYTPLRSDEPSVASKRVFYGAINIFIEQKLPWFRHIPAFAHRWLDRPGILRRISASRSTTDARELGALTLSMLQGEEGRQARELEELVAWLRDEFKPDIVHLAYSMLLGLAPALKRELKVPIVCSLQGEDIFLEDLDADYKARVLETLRSLGADVDCFVATSDYYRRFMTDYLDLPPEKVTVAPIGISLDGHRSLEEEIPVRTEDPLVLGFLARICPEKGLHVLLAAFRELTEVMGMGAVKLRIAGWVGGRDRDYLAGIKRTVAEAGLAEDVEGVGEVDRDGKIRFLQSLDILSVPTTYHEPKGLYLLEAMANGIPVVQPAHGAFPEVIEATGGGVVVESGSTAALAGAILELWRDPERRRRLGEAGRQAVHVKLSAAVMGAETMTIYRQVARDS